MTLNKRHVLNRGAGVLMPISSLPSQYGIGTLGKEGFRFVDFLKQIGCSYWQVLPVGPTSYGDSPYQSYSAFAGNPFFIDLEFLVKDKLLMQEEIAELNWQEKDDCVDYAKLYQLRFTVLRKAFGRSKHTISKQYKLFCENNKDWLEDYALFMAVKNHFDDKEWSLWDQDIKNREREAVEKYTILFQEEIRFWEFCQFKFRQQWDDLKAYANQSNIQIIGDIPLYVSRDSADVWVHGELFDLDHRKNPIRVAGVPPDAFSDTGQRWGNPLYLWEVKEQDIYSWWRKRMQLSGKLYDVIRIDHFIGIVNYYSIPADSETAMEGNWQIGPGSKLTDVIEEAIGSAKIIAEDLGIVTDKVRDLIDKNGYSCMKVLGFGLQGPSSNEYLPHNYKDTNLIAYTGTHDNETLVGYFKDKSEEELQFAYKYFHVNKRKDLSYAIIRALYSSVANVIIIPMQDLLKLDNTARMNSPSTIGGNWNWRMKKSQYKQIYKKKLKEYADIYSRIPNKGKL